MYTGIFLSIVLTAGIHALFNGMSPTVFGAYAQASVTDLVSNQSDEGLVNCGLAVTTTKALKSDAGVNTVEYTLLIENTGQRVCNNASMSVYYAENMRVVGVLPAATAGQYYWRLGSLESGATRAVTVVVIASSDSAAGLEACVTADNGQDVCVIGEQLVAEVTTPVIEETSPAEESPVVTEPLTGVSKEYGLWVWESPQGMSVSYIDSLMASVRANNFTALYVTVDDYLTINSMAEGAAKQSKKKAYFDAIERLVIEAKKNNVAIDALAGSKDWAQPAMRYKAFAIVDMVLEYNAERGSNALRSLQYDVEPYLLSTYERNKAPVLTEFVALIDETNKRLGNANVRFAVTIPHFYDSAQAWTPKVTYGGTTTYTFTHLMRILDTRKDSTIILMSYRNFAAGNNGTIQISNVEVTEASAAGHATKVIVGQEFGKVTPAYVTFYGKTRAQYQTEHAKIIDAFSLKDGFGGTAVHYFEPFSVLK